MPITIPYFYIIRHIPSNKLYAGSRWSNGCHPSELLMPNGYKTSSSQIHNLINVDGLNSFEIISILTEDECGCHPLNYETNFLRSNNIASDVHWINLHNNDKFGPAYGTLEYDALILKKYGVKHISELEWVREKVKNTLYEKTGYYYTFQNPETKTKCKQTWLEKTGYDNPSKDPKIKDKKKKTLLKNYGVEHALQNPHIMEKIVQNRLQNTGYEYPMQNPEVLAKSKESYKKLRSRDIVKCINYFLETNHLFAKDIGLSRRWAIQSQDKLFNAINDLFSCYPKIN